MGMGEKAASVLLKLFINGNERCHTTDIRMASRSKAIWYI